VSLAPGTRLGPYEITGQIGAGGMGEVYRARDTKLQRDVAIKILREAVAHDSERLARFEREARTLASLNHPNIGQIHGLEESDGIKALVMELVEGPTLADRIAQRPIPVDEALPIAKQIAEALEAAHEQGIIHRDLKPANVKVRPDGMVKVLDFGLAKALEPVSAGSTDATTSPTITSPAMMTRMGVILGTAAYMSPEQATGKAVDKRSDLWAFGVVLLEMLTGRPVFSGETVSHVLAAVLKDEPHWTTLPANTPAAIRRLLRRCLEKDRKRRLDSAADAQLEIDEALATQPVDGSLTVPAARRRERLAWATAVAAAVALGISLFVFTRPAPQPGTVVRFQVSPPSGTRMTYGPASPHQAVSPDGRHVAYVVVDDRGRGMLAVQSFDALQPRVLPGTDIPNLGAGGGGDGLPFWSPDSRFIGFFAQGKLQRIDVNGGRPQEVCDAPNGQGGTWSRDGTILFAQPASGLFRVPAAGGTPTPLTPLGSGGKVSETWPWFLPDGRHFLYATTAPTKIYVGSLDSQERVELLASDSKAIYAARHLLFVRQRTLLAQPFDPVQLTISGESFPVVEDLAVNPIGVRAAFSASTAGVLTYRTTPASRERQLVWVDRAGAQVGVVGDPAGYSEVELAPDGARAAVTIAGAVANRDIWVVDVARGVRTPLTSDPADEQSPRWSPSGDQIVFTRAGPKPGLYLTAASGTGREALLLALERAFPDSWSPNGMLLYDTLDPNVTGALWMLALGNRKASLLVDGEGRQAEGRFSPNGRWVAYASNETGQPEIFVVSFPDLRMKSRISTAGGVAPRWSRDERELFYLAPDNTLMAAAVNGQGPAFQVGTVRRVFERALQPGGGGTYRYDVSGDGQRFLVNTPLEPQESLTLTLTVVMNWTAGVKK
jgi:eukaryotic-like serine/threonine-protein kinase